MLAVEIPKGRIPASPLHLFFVHLNPRKFFSTLPSHNYIVLSVPSTFVIETAMLIARKNEVWVRDGNEIIIIIMTKQ